jgi:hypothetical protein
MMKSTNAEVWSCYASGCGALTVRKDKASERDLREKMNGERQRVVFDEGYSTYEGAKALRDACTRYEDRLSLVIASDIRERCMGRDIGDVPYLPCYQEWCKAVGLKPGPFIG